METLLDRIQIEDLLTRYAQENQWQVADLQALYQLRQRHARSLRRDLRAARQPAGRMIVVIEEEQPLHRL